MPWHPCALCGLGNGAHVDQEVGGEVCIDCAETALTANAGVDLAGVLAALGRVAHAAAAEQYAPILRGFRAAGPGDGAEVLALHGRADALFAVFADYMDVADLEIPELEHYADALEAAQEIDEEPAPTKTPPPAPPALVEVEDGGQTVLRLRPRADWRSDPEGGRGRRLLERLAQDYDEDGDHDLATLLRTGEVPK